MITYVWKHPEPETLARLQNLPADADAPGAPYEPMTQEEYKTWYDGEIKGGWKPAEVEMPPKGKTDEERLASIEAKLAGVDAATK